MFSAAVINAENEVMVINDSAYVKEPYVLTISSLVFTTIHDI